MKNCDFVNYYKEIEKKNYAPGRYRDKLFAEYILDNNNTLVEKGFKMAFDSFVNFESYHSLRKDIFEDAIVVHLRFEEPDIVAIDTKYTIDDKMANFGGTYGIFAELTGCSLLGLLNIIVIIANIVHGLIVSKM